MRQRLKCASRNNASLIRVCPMFDLILIAATLTFFGFGALCVSALEKV